MKVKVSGIERDNKQILECFYNVIARLQADQFMKADWDIKVVEKALKEISNIEAKKAPIETYKDVNSKSKAVPVRDRITKGLYVYNKAFKENPSFITIAALFNQDIEKDLIALNSILSSTITIEEEITGKAKITIDGEYIALEPFINTIKDAMFLKVSNIKDEK